MTMTRDHQADIERERGRRAYEAAMDDARGAWEEEHARSDVIEDETCPVCDFGTVSDPSDECPVCGATERIRTEHIEEDRPSLSMDGAEMFVESRKEEIKEEAWRARQERETAKLPDDVANRHSKTFDLRGITAILRDTYYLGPIKVGKGGYHGVHGDGKPGTGLRRPSGALYNKPENIRVSILNKAEETGLIKCLNPDADEASGDLVGRYGSRVYAATDRGADLLRELVRCEDHDEDPEPFIETSHYQAGTRHETSSRLVLRCASCRSSSGREDDPMAGSMIIEESSTSGLTEFARRESSAEYAERVMEDHEDVEVWMERVEEDETPGF